MRALDWAATPIGSPQHWPQTWRSAANLFLPQVVLLDLGLPEMDGYEVARRLRGMRQLNGIRLVALTGYGQADDRQRVRSGGFDEHLMKPVNLTSVARAIAGIAQSAGGGR